MFGSKSTSTRTRTTSSCTMFHDGKSSSCTITTIGHDDGDVGKTLQSVIPYEYEYEYEYLTRQV